MGNIPTFSAPALARGPLCPMQASLHNCAVMRRALLSVSDKRDLLPLARRLDALGWQLIASGGTAQALHAAGLPVSAVDEITGAPEMLDGRVKTLHPAIHAAILARDRAADRAELSAHGIQPIDLVVCNLYPFAKAARQRDVALEQAVAQIDIGGVALLRAAAKNFGRVAVLCDPADYGPVAAELEGSGGVSQETRQQLAGKAFRHTRDYDAAISAYFDSLGGEHSGPDLLPRALTLNLPRVEGLRYGENPHQAAALYGHSAASGPLGGRLLQGKALSYNNLLDLDAAWRAVVAFDEPAVAIVKHLSPCGIAAHAHSVARALPAALAADPISAFGGVIAANRPLDASFTAALAAAGLFVEALVAPAFSAEALAWLAGHKKNCRVLALEGADLAAERAAQQLELRAVRAGILVQTRDGGDAPGAVWRVVTRRQPEGDELAALRFAWTAVAHVKSNAIVLARESATVGIGGGLPSRVDAVRLAIAKAGERAAGAVMASDAFFPFPDGLELAAAAGVGAVVQPGGSMRDEAVIAAADQAGMAMIFSGARHFRH